MTDDVDMDAPQISTLREETTPEPNPAKSKVRVKLLMNDKAEGSKAGSTSSKHGRAESDEDDNDDDDEEEDQLIDDDDDDVLGWNGLALVVIDDNSVLGNKASDGLHDTERISVHDSMEH